MAGTGCVVDVEEVLVGLPGTDELGVVGEAGEVGEVCGAEVGELTGALAELHCVATPERSNATTTATSLIGWRFVAPSRWLRPAVLCSIRFQCPATPGWGLEPLVTAGPTLFSNLIDAGLETPRSVPVLGSPSQVSSGQAVFLVGAVGETADAVEALFPALSERLEPHGGTGRARMESVMPTRCLHGLDPSGCLICRTLAGDGPPGAAAAPGRGTRRAQRRQAAPGPDTGWASASLARSAPLAAPAPPTGHHLGPVAMLAVAVALLLAVGAAVWLLVGVVFTILRVFELVAVAGGAGWAGYRIGHFRGSRHPRR